MPKSRGHQNSDNLAMAGVNNIFVGRYKGIELNCLVGNILACNSTIGIICDSRFTLNGGLAKQIKDIAGNEFMANLQKARQEQDTIAIAVKSTPNLSSNYVIFYPIRSVDRNVLDRAYWGIFGKALELRIPYLTIPLLGTGQLGLTVDVAINYLRNALMDQGNFGHLQKLQFIDQHENTMQSLIGGCLNQLVTNWAARQQQQNSNSQQQGPSTSQQPPQQQGTSSTSSDSTFSPSSSSHSTVLSVSAPGSSINFNISILSSGTDGETIDEAVMDLTGTGEDEDMDDEDEEDSSDSDDDDDDDDSDLEDSSDEDVMGGFFTDSDQSDRMDATNSTESPTQKKIRIEEEKTFWKRITAEELLVGKDEEEDKEAPSSSSKLAKLDESTMPCSICLSDMREEQENADAIVQLTLCDHRFHEECIRAAFKVKKQCPLCMCFYGYPIGCQPLNATMNVRIVPGPVPGHPDAKGFHEIAYYVPAGIQTENHMRPGVAYRSSHRIAYLPNNAEGTEVLKLLQLAFKRRLIFTIGDSNTTGRKNVPVWNGIHHKTNKDGGSQCYGYPDPQYLQRVKEELAMVGVEPNQL